MKCKKVAILQCCKTALNAAKTPTSPSPDNPRSHSLLPYLIVLNTRNALSALIALNIRSNLKMAATSNEPTFCTISGSRKFTMVKRTINKSGNERYNFRQHTKII